MNDSPYLGGDGLGGAKWQQGDIDIALDARADVDTAIFCLLEEEGVAAGSAEPEVFHAPGCAITGCAGDIEDVDTAFAEIVERLAALWIGAVIHHKGPSPEAMG